MPSKTKLLALAVALNCACGVRSGAPLLGMSDSGVSDSGPFEGGIPDSGSIVGCHLTVTPSSVDFGGLAAGSVATQQILLASDGTDSCLVRDLDLTPSTDSVFSLPSGTVASATLAPGTSLAIDVEFAPQAVGCYGGFLAFPADRAGIALGAQSIFLTGVGQAQSTSCLEVPQGFCQWRGDGQHCATGKRRFSVINNCQGTLTIDSVTLVPADAGFRVVGATIPESIPAGQSSNPIELSFGASGAQDSYVGATVVMDGYIVELETFFETGVAVALGGATFHGDVQTDTFTGQELVSANQVPLSGTPAPGSLNVMLDGNSLATSDWSYDSAANTVVLSSSLDLQRSDVLTVSYWLTCP
jgi:hypothetical protein